MQTLDSTFSFYSVQSLDLTRLGMQRQTGIASTVFKSVEKAQPFCQQAERFAVQNKIADASPHQRSAPNRKTIHSAQILLCHEERSALQNKKSAGAIEPALRFDRHRKNLMNQSGKAHTGFQGDGIECDLVLGPKARPIPALGNAQGTRKPIRSKQLPSSHRSASGPKGPGVERWEESGRASSLSSSKPRPLALAGMDRTVGA